jgi:protein-tyrosine kinase
MRKDYKEEPVIDDPAEPAQVPPTGGEGHGQGAMQPTDKDRTGAVDTAKIRRTLMLGSILVANGKLRPEQVDLILSEQKRLDLRFGETAIRLRLVTHEDVEEALAIQFGYSSSRATALALPGKVTTAVNPYSPFAEALRGLRSQLMLRWFDGTPERAALAVTSVNRGDGKSFVVANLGVAFSQIGQRTLIIDGDLRHPTQHLNFGIRNPMGLSGILSGRAGFEEIVEFPTLPNLAVMPSGPRPPNPQELLGREAFDQLLRHLSTKYDVILIDTPSAQESADSLVMAQRARGALIVGRKDKTKSSDIAQLSSVFTSAGVTLLGATLNEY